MERATRTLINGTAIPVRGHDIDTDRIIPARFLKCVVFEGLGAAAFEDDRAHAKARGEVHPFDDPRFRTARILLVNRNFGCGSSREHAPQALYRFGIQAIVGESFAAIFAGNCTMMGLPTVVVDAKEIAQLMKSVEDNPRTEYTVDLESRTISYGGEKIPIDLPETYRTALTQGYWDSTTLLRANLDAVKKTAAKLPYMTGFTA
jgi:3-isopropylmalate/(R)-2-methylmalate dehydratase small subunit